MSGLNPDAAPACNASSIMSPLPQSLRYSSQDEPGISRRRRGKGFSYHEPDGALIRCEKTTSRIKGLGLPPAYEDVWICKDAKGHLQAAGTDQRGRRQYRYHADWRAFQDLKKFDRLEEFGRNLPRLRTQIDYELRRRTPDKAQICAAILRLIDQTAMRVGSALYAQENGTFGAATLRSRHLRLDGSTLKLSYTAKGGKRVRKQVQDRRLARTLDRIGDLPGRDLFSCIDQQTGDIRKVRSNDVNEYIALVTGHEVFTTKTFRTWHGSVSALQTAFDVDGRLTIKAMSERAADRLHNTPSIARGSYIHPDVIALAELSAEALKGRLDDLDLRRAPNALPREEKQLIALLRA